MRTKILDWKHQEISPADYFEIVRTGENDILLESTRKSKNGRFSYIALDPRTIVKSKNGYNLINGIYQKVNPLDAIKQELVSSGQVKPEGFPLFYDGAVGYFGYDFKNLIEPKLRTTAKRDTNFWDCYFVFPRIVIGFDNTEGKIFISSSEDSRLDTERLENILRNGDVGRKVEARENASNFQVETNLSFEEYKKLFDIAKEYVLSGDTYQVKISIRHEFNASFDHWNVYKKLRTVNPSPYAAFLDLDEMTLISCSPEELARLEGRVAETRPIGGTYRSGCNEDEDQKISQSFFEDEKEVAEHSMLIDLERNDLGRVCEMGSVKITEKMALEKYTNLMHIVTTIRGNLAKDKDSFDLIRSMFPGGTVTGCPKIRTMEIIDELEPVARGVYTGSIGFITPSDNCQFNIIIRTLVIDKKTKKGYIQVGGGIVADSNAEYEYEENLRKGRAIVDVLCS